MADMMNPYMSMFGGAGMDPEMQQQMQKMMLSQFLMGGGASMAGAASRPGATVGQSMAGMMSGGMQGMNNAFSMALKNQMYSNQQERQRQQDERQIERDKATDKYRTDYLKIQSQKADPFGLNASATSTGTGAGTGSTPQPKPSEPVSAEPGIATKAANAVRGGFGGLMEDTGKYWGHKAYETFGDDPAGWFSEKADMVTDYWSDVFSGAGKQLGDQKDALPATRGQYSVPSVQPRESMKMPSLAAKGQVENIMRQRGPDGFKDQAVWEKLSSEQRDYAIMLMEAALKQ